MGPLFGIGLDGRNILNRFTQDWYRCVVFALFGAVLEWKSPCLNKRAFYFGYFYMQSTLTISDTDISEYPLISDHNGVSKKFCFDSWPSFSYI